jgi:predicted DNA-binding transcriptional regulator AlpA
MPAGLSKPTLEALAEELAGLRELVLSRVRLHRKEVLLRYGIGKDTLYRRMKRGDFPRPSRIAGPVWTLADLEAAEAAGRLPCPKPDAARTRPASGVRP